jgi:transcriptional regulator with XRE-family HTH domain
MSRTVEVRLHETQDSKTVDQIIGANLKRLRQAEAMTLGDVAVVLTHLGFGSFSEAKLSRWENGLYPFTVNDLHMLSQVFGVNIVAFLKPDKNTTRVETPGGIVPAETYAYDFLIDPQGRFTERARRIAARKKHGAWDVDDALDDIDDQLKDKGRIADLAVAALNTARLKKAMEDNPDQPAWKTMNDLYNAGQLRPADERHDDGT